jgi:hypothetical protein
VTAAPEPPVEVAIPDSQGAPILGYASSINRVTVSITPFEPKLHQGRISFVLSKSIVKAFLSFRGKIVVKLSELSSLYVAQPSKLF